MAVTQALLTSGSSTTDGTSFATASVAPSANKLLLLSVVTSDHNSGAPTAAGNSLTWVEVQTRTFGFFDLYDRRRLTVFRAMGSSPTSGTITITIPTTNASGCAWVLSEFDGVDTSGTNGSGAVVQAVGIDSDAANTGLTVTLAAFASSTNATWGTFAANAAITPGSGFTELAEPTYATPIFRVQTEWKDSADTTVDATWASIAWTGAIAVEIAEAAAAAVNLYPTGDGTDTDVVDEGDATSDLFASIDDDPATPSDGDWNNNTDDAGQAFYELTDMPADFDEASSATITVRYRGQAFDGTGTVTLYARLYQSDETTALSDEVQVAQVTADTSFANTSAVTLTGIVASTKTVWDAARLRLRWART